jgi:hypothetical protein
LEIINLPEADNEPMITTADWMRYIDSLGPSEESTMKSRLRSAGADPAYADFLVGLIWKRQVSRRAAQIAFVLLAIGLAWSAYECWLAFQGSPKGPEFSDIAFPVGLLVIGGLTLIISSASEISPAIDLSSNREIPRDLAPPPRAITFAAAKSGAAWRLAIGVICFMLMPLLFAAPEMRKRVMLRDHGVETVGHVTGKFITRGSKGSSHYHLRYSFDGGSGSTSVSRKSYEETNEGESLPVTYDRDQPQINLARTKAQLKAVVIDEPVWIALIVYFVVVLPLILIVIRFGTMTQRILGERGVAAVAEVTGISRQSVTYRFGEHTGRWFWGKRRVRERPSVGQPLVILYDPEKPPRNLPLGALGDFEISAHPPSR